MAQNITLMGASYQDVPSVLLPKTGGGTAAFDDTTISSNAASAGDIATGKLAWVNGLLITGTGSGGSSPWHKLVNAQENSVNSTATQAASAFTISLGSSAYNKDQIIWVHIRDKAGKRDGHFFGSDVFFMNYQKANGGTSTLSVLAIETFRYSGTTLTGYSGQYGVYGYSIDSAGKLTVRRRYSSSYSLTINGTYVTNVYAIDLPDSLTLF